MEEDSFQTLATALAELQQKNAGLLQENRLLADSLARLPPDALRPHPQLLPEQTGKKLSKKLTSSQKLTIAQKEADDLWADIEGKKKSSALELERGQAEIDTMEAEIADLRKESFEFRQQIIVGAQSLRTSKIMAEKVRKYFEGKLLQKSTLLDKLMLKNSGLVQQLRKTEHQLTHRQDAGETLDGVDYQQLQIENQQFLEKIDQRNKQLLELKLNAVLTQQALNNLKKKLRQTTAEGEATRHGIETRLEAVARISEETTRVRKARNKAANYNRILTAHNQNQDSNRPQVLDYIKQKATLYELEKQVANWERKVEIAEALLRQQRTASTTSTPVRLSSTPLASTAMLR